MTPQEFSKAKANFLSLIELDDLERGRAIKVLECDDPIVAAEVKSLIDNHMSRTIIRSDQATLPGHDDSTSHRTLAQGILNWRFSLVGGVAPISIALLASLIFWIVGWEVKHVLQSRLEYSQRLHLQTFLDLEYGMLDQWGDAATLKIEAWARSAEVKKAVSELVDLAKSSLRKNLRDQLFESPAQLALEKEINSLAGLRWSKDAPLDRTQKFSVWNREGINIADWSRKKNPSRLGRGPSSEDATKLSRLLQESSDEGNSTMIYLPRARSETRPEMESQEELAEFQVQIVTSITDDQGNSIAALMISDQEITDELESAIRTGCIESTGECYLMDMDGWMINEPRCVDEMKKHGVFRDHGKKWHNRYSVRVADPGGNIFSGFVPTEPISQWVPTRAARSALNRSPGLDIKGYRDFAGRPTIGAWRWAPRLNSALVVEQTASEAYQTIGLMGYANAAAWGLPLFCVFGIAVGSVVRSYMRRGKPPRRIGAYRIIEKIGEGGLGIVYRAEHMLLHRPSAIKLLKNPITSHHTTLRFEREVRLAANLVHPNALNIYDYGLSDQGAFYYAMEYVHGVNLGEFMAYKGFVPIDRSLHLLIQLCGAINEAHLEGLVHRDIKPQNIMVCSRGGMADVVKVLDYGLVKSFVAPEWDHATETMVVMGTPKFMAPERLTAPWLADPRIDIYSIGTVAYFLMHGHSPNLGMTTGAMLDLMANEHSPWREFSQQTPFQEFIRLIGDCIAINPVMRPPSVIAVNEVLRRIQASYPWQQAYCESWWAEHEKRVIDFSVQLRKGGMLLHS